MSVLFPHRLWEFTFNCGGSEFFVRKGRRYVADIPACVAWVRRAREEGHYGRVRVQLEAKASEARALKAEAARAEAREALERIAKPEYGIGFNRLRGIARTYLARPQGDQP